MISEKADEIQEGIGNGTYNTHEKIEVLQDHIASKNLEDNYVVLRKSWLLPDFLKVESP